MKTFLSILASILALVVAGLAVVPGATPQPPVPQPLPAPTVVPNLITVNTSTTVLFTVLIPQATLNPARVELLRIDTGSTQSLVAQMHDDGRYGDDRPGDNVFTARMMLNEKSPGAVIFQVSAAFRGTQAVVMSPPNSVMVSPPVRQGFRLYSDAELRLMLVHPDSLTGSRHGSTIVLTDSRFPDLPSSFQISIFSEPMTLISRDALEQFARDNLAQDFAAPVSAVANGIVVRTTTLRGCHFYAADARTHRLFEIRFNCSFLDDPVLSSVLSGVVLY